MPFGAQAQVNAIFTAQPSQGCSPLQVQFSDQSTGNVTGWEWIFSNGVTSNFQNPSVTFINAGTYDAILIVTDGNQFDTLRLDDLITVYANPTVAFNISGQTSGCVSFQVNFQDQSLQGNGAIVSWLWDFGDGNISNLQNPVHTYH